MTLWQPSSAAANAAASVRVEQHGFHVGHLPQAVEGERVDIAHAQAIIARLGQQLGDHLADFSRAEQKYGVHGDVSSVAGLSRKPA